MNLKHLRSVLCLVSVSALFTDGALAQSGGAGDMRAKFADDYNAGKYKDAIADAAALQKLGVLDPQMAMVAAQAHFKAGDYDGCAKYILDNPVLSKDLTIDDEHPSGELLERCRPWPQP